VRGAAPPVPSTAPLGGPEDTHPAARTPHRLRLSIHLASVKDLAEAAFVVAHYHYPHLAGGGASAPVRSGVVWYVSL
jgi:hypothetical protein